MADITTETGPTIPSCCQQHGFLSGESLALVQAGDDQALTQEVFVELDEQGQLNRILGVDTLTLQVVPELGHVVRPQCKDVEGLQQPDVIGVRRAVQGRATL